METLSLFRHETDFESFPAGHIIFEIGQPGDVMYVVKEGEVNIVIGDEVLETAGPGALVGEMALVDAEPRSATAVAKTDCQLVPINEKRFTFLVQQHPYFSLHVMRVIANRLRRMDMKV